MGRRREEEKGRRRHDRGADHAERHDNQRQRLEKDLGSAAALCSARWTTRGIA
jgi:hypothetical protein